MDFLKRLTELSNSALAHLKTLDGKFMENSVYSPTICGRLNVEHEEFQKKVVKGRLRKENYLMRAAGENFLGNHNYCSKNGLTPPHL